MPIFNYVREHRRFIRYASDNKLTSSERLLWYALVEIINEESEGNVWPDEFIRISNGRLLMLCDPMGEDTLFRARNGLKQRGLIEFKPGNRNKENPAYRVKLFYPEGYPQNTGNTGGNIQGSMWCNTLGNTGGNMPASIGDIYINQNKGYTVPKTEKYGDDEDDFRVRGRGGIALLDMDDPIPNRGQLERDTTDGYRMAFGHSPYASEVDKLVNAAWMMGFTQETLNRAMEIAAENGARNPAEYTMRILGSWHNAGIRTPEEADAARAERDLQAGRL